MEKIVAISNTGPLISTFQCNMESLLKHYFSAIFVTNTEIVEITSHGWLKDFQILVDDGLIKIIDHLYPNEIQLAKRIAKMISILSSQKQAEWKEHLPEAEAIALMHERSVLSIDILLLDERAARSVTQQIGLRLTGFPGILGKAGLDRILTGKEIEKLLQKCQAKGTHYSNELIKKVVNSYGR